MQPIEKYIAQRLQERVSENNFRSLKIVRNKIDFTSNDYLGIARDAKFQAHVQHEFSKANVLLGSTGSRLLSGNSALAETLEKEIAIFHRSESALLFNSGFDANYGLLSSLPYKNDTLIYDELCHASIHDGVRASKANAVSFQHNNVEDLAVKTKQ